MKYVKTRKKVEGKVKIVKKRDQTQEKKDEAGKEKDQRTQEA